MRDVLQTNDAWIAEPCESFSPKARTPGAFSIDNIADAANTILGGILLAVLNRSMSGTDTTDPPFLRQISEQTVQGVLRR